MKDASHGDKPAASDRSAMRIDGPHSIVDERPSDGAADVLDEQASGPAGRYPMDAAEQVLAQAGQLAGHLRARQRDLDRREAQLNARVAELEKELRLSRLWFQEREKEFAQREAELERRILQLEEQAAALSAAALSAEREASEQAKATPAADRPSAESAGSAAFCLDSAEAIFHEQLRRLEAERKELAAERERLKQQAREARGRFAQHQKLAEAELDNKRRRLDQRSRHLNTREAAFAQIRDEALRLHRESIELRLVAQQLWSQLAERIAPAQLTRSLSRVRAKLDDHYRITRERLAQQRDELNRLSAKLDARRSELCRQRDELQGWVARRQAEIEEQAARLVAREQELDRQEEHYREMQQAWNDERRQYQRQIHQLLRGRAAAAPASA